MKRTAGLVGLVALVCSCTPTVAKVTVDPETATLGAKSAQATFRVILKDAQGQRITAPSLVPSWRSSAPIIASVDESGKVTAQTSGEAVITAVVGQVSGEARVTISIPAVVTLTPATLELKARGERASLEAKVTDDSGKPLPGKQVDWGTSDPAVARVVAGQVTAMAPGTAVITATLETLKGEAKVTVNPPAAPAFRKLVVKPAKLKVRKGRSAKLRATALDRRGKAVADVPVTWKSSNSTIAKVEAGRVTGVKKGKVKITATAGRKTATAKVTVTR